MNNNIDWSFLDSNYSMQDAFGFFAQGGSGRNLYLDVKGGPYGGLVRNMLRTHGVKRLRSLARKALQRRCDISIYALAN